MEKKHGKTTTPHFHLISIQIQLKYTDYGPDILFESTVFTVGILVYSSVEA